MAKYINKEEILKFPIRTHPYDRERGNAHYIKSIECVDNDFCSHGEKRDF